MGKNVENGAGVKISTVVEFPDEGEALFGKINKGKLRYYARFSIKVQLVCVLTFYNYKCMLTITDI